jgi:hypothetical protein
MATRRIEFILKHRHFNCSRVDKQGLNLTVVLNRILHGIK